MVDAMENAVFRSWLVVRRPRSGCSVMDTVPPVIASTASDILDVSSPFVARKKTVIKVNFIFHY